MFVFNQYFWMKAYKNHCVFSCRLGTYKGLRAPNLFLLALSLVISGLFALHLLLLLFFPFVINLFSKLLHAVTSYQVDWAASLQRIRSWLSVICIIATVVYILLHTWAWIHFNAIASPAQSWWWQGQREAEHQRTSADRRRLSWPLTEALPEWVPIKVHQIIPNTLAL